MTKEEVIAALERCACGKECVNCILCENVENAMREAVKILRRTCRECANAVNVADRDPERWLWCTACRCNKHPEGSCDEWMGGSDDGTEI